MEAVPLNAFARALVAERAKLYRFALGITRDQHLAADLVQDTMLRALERSEQFRGDAPIGAWLRRILHRLAIDRGRRAAREVVVEEVEDAWRDDAYSVDPAVDAERHQAREEIEDALARLPFIYRAAVLLHDVEGWTVREISEVQEIGLPAAKQRLRRGRMALVTALAEGRARRRELEGVPMRCWDARLQVSDYLDGVLDEAACHVLETHLETCPTCPPLYAALVDAHEQLGSLRDPDAVVPPTLDRRIRSVLSERAAAIGPDAEIHSTP